MGDQDTIVSSYVDGVYSLFSRKYQIEVIADGQRLEVKSPQHIFRNRVTGMCGDLNGEWSADMKSAKQCIVTKPKLSIQLHVGRWKMSRRSTAGKIKASE